MARVLEQYYADGAPRARTIPWTRIDRAGDGLFAAFDGPARAIRCACRIRDEVRSLGLEVRSGLHAGECEVLGDKIGGIAVHIGARVAAAAEPGKSWSSNTVKDLVAGSGIAIQGPRHAMRSEGLPGEWPLFVVTGAAYRVLVPAGDDPETLAVTRRPQVRRACATELRTVRKGSDLVMMFSSGRSL